MEVLISVIVPIYNVEKYLKKCVDSIINQTYRNLEIILVDDGSTDYSGIICDKYLEIDTRIKVIHLKNSGVSSARNKGIEAASGDYIIFCDSDDYIKETLCEDLKNIILDNKNSFVICGYEIHNERLKKRYKILFDYNQEKSFLKNKEFFELYEKNLFNYPWNKIFDKNIILKNNIRFDTTLSLGEDMLFNLEYLSYIKEDIVIINKDLYNYVLKESESLDNKFYPNLYDIYNYLFDNLYKHMESLNVDLKKYENKYWISYFYLLEKVLKNTLDKKNNLSILEKIKYNSNIVKSERFKKSIKFLNNENCNHLYLKLLNTNTYIFILLGSKIISLLSNLKKYLNKIKVSNNT